MCFLYGRNARIISEIVAKLRKLVDSILECDAMIKNSLEKKEIFNMQDFQAWSA